VRRGRTPARQVSGTTATSGGLSPLTAFQRMSQCAVLDCWAFFGQCSFVFQAAFVKFRSSRSTSFGVRYPRAE